METASLPWRTLCVWIKRKYGLQEIREIENLMQHSEKERFPTFIQFVIAFVFQLFNRRNIFIYNCYFFYIWKKKNEKNKISPASLDGKSRSEIMNLKWWLLPSPASRPFSCNRRLFTLVIFARLFIAPSLFSSLLFPHRTISLWIFYTIQMNSVNWSAVHGRLPFEMFWRGV